MQIGNFIVAPTLRLELRIAISSVWTLAWEIKPIKDLRAASLGSRSRGIGGTSYVVPRTRQRSQSQDAVADLVIEIDSLL